MSISAIQPALQPRIAINYRKNDNQQPQPTFRSNNSLLSPNKALWGVAGVLFAGIAIPLLSLYFLTGWPFNT